MTLAPDLCSFSIARLPRIEFGSKSLEKLPAITATYGQHILLVTGKSSFLNSERAAWLLQAWKEQGSHCKILHVNEEPSPQWVDENVARLKDEQFDVVVGIGGGSPLDAAKAVAGLLKPGNSVMDHLEGVGPELSYKGPTTPFIAVPTTAGTGSEATKNAVLSVQGEAGFKKSFRHDSLVAEYAIVDPDLLTSCTPEMIAANGLDAFTQLLESFVSIRSNPFTEALASSGITAVRDSLLTWYENPEHSQAREKMAYAALLSGICLAQTGLGSVHGLGAPLGSFFPIGHGVACGTLLAEATRMNINVMEQRDPDNPALKKYAEVGELLHGQHDIGSQDAHNFLVQS
ncbi:MAG: iron-containing alcohol dehydrogenase, partial [Gammaproteobacteria bacterium]|nr:iron-containing alcohol dehydrogenase [Gammaproteobacteria bacterium]